MHDNPTVDGPAEVKPVSPDDISSTDPLAFVPIATASLIANGSSTGAALSPSRLLIKRPARPATAPSQEHLALLPSLGRSHTISLPSSPYHETPSRSHSGVKVDLGQADTLQDLKPVQEEPVIRLCPPRNLAEWDWSSEAGSLPQSADCDWATFISAYALGRWDPHQVPHPPRSYHIASEVSHSQPTTTDPVQLSQSLPPRSSDNEPPPEPSVGFTVSSFESTTSSVNSVSIPPSRLLPFQLSLPGTSHRTRSSFSSSTSANSLFSNSASTSCNADIQTTVATMRWAAARVDISPLALPSPEHELTDPMRGVTATLPTSYSHAGDGTSDNVTTAASNRRSRLSSFWEGTTDIDSTDLPTPSHAGRPSIDIDSEESPQISIVTQTATPEPATGSSMSPQNALSDPMTHLSILAAPAPATAPIRSVESQPDDVEPADYFGGVHAKPAEKATSSNMTLKQAAVDLISPISSTDEGSLTVPALPRRVCLTRQSSSPLPITSPTHEPRLPGGRVTSENLTVSKTSRAAKEEQMYTELGYLAPPNPPDELERRRALYKFNIWNTGPDLNFDRIAHLAKLVFNTKGVVISLIDGKEQWFKAECGSLFPAKTCPRSQSLCGHAILQQGDEPMMVLDTRLDWRFAENPLVTGSPQIRFYAGAPLRTQDGYNIGTLAVMDDAPRDDFPPRQRHTLKEFAAIAMREMELWRDKIQLRIRDRIQSSMEQFSRECLEIDNEVHNRDKEDYIIGSSMDKVYDRAAKLVQRTLDVEGVIVMDVSHCEVLETMSAEGSVSVILHHGDPESEMEKRQLSTEEYHKLNNFFAKYPDGKILEGILPHMFRQFMPTHIRYALTVPIFNIDKRPFALICAYNTNEHSKRFLEGHELSYLRAIGVIILSAVLKRRMILADKAKSLFISNISHELRTPLHGILAAAELLSDSPLTHSQVSFIQTVQACGTSLVETVNHVLDFTKLSGNSKAGGVDNVIVSTMTDLAQLIEDAVDGSWIGHRARTAITGDSAIGSVYSPPSDDQGTHTDTSQPVNHVETVIDIGYREQGWLLKLEKGGIRRVLMNLFGNSLKFTTDGYVLVKLRLLPRADKDPPQKVRVELAVEDTGKGISRNFLKNQLFHPFSQENPLQTGTGLGLAIVNSIVTSENVGGKVDVWSEEGTGTEIRVTFPAQAPEDDYHMALASQEVQPFRMEDGSQLPSVKMLGFDASHRGVQMLKSVIHRYVTEWWGLRVEEGPGRGDIVIVNEDTGPLIDAVEGRDISRPFVILWGARGNPSVLTVTGEYEKMGGFCRILYKPGGPTRLRAMLKLCIHAWKIGPGRPGVRRSSAREADRYSSAVWRRNSDETYKPARINPGTTRPAMHPRSLTVAPSSIPSHLRNVVTKHDEDLDQDTPVTTMSDPTLATISVGSGGSLLKSAVQSPETTVISDRKTRVLVVEDNTILRNLLIKWLAKKGYDFKDAVDGLEGVTLYREDGPFDVVLIDLSMPVLDGVAATEQMRKIESQSGDNPPSPDQAHPHITKILALTGMSSLEDKRKAFDAGVDGYLVKPVAFRTLDDMFQKLGIP